MAESDFSVAGLVREAPAHYLCHPWQSSDTELLQVLIGDAEVTRLYRGSLGRFFDDPGDADAPQLCGIARELVRRWLAEKLKTGAVFQDPGAVSEFLKLHFAGRTYESFVVLFLDAHLRLISAEEMFRGTLTQTSVYPREVVVAALSKNAATVILSHNHPSGSVEPSVADEALTHTLQQALALVDIRVLDHIIVAGADTLSFAQRGLL
ncbi:DNA repair protein RadC [Rhodoferax sp. WC2427]|uniref:RadC family protein n=1 Tax=Rhodoferax sp. WC2427 TaxID=3234144 RepID=UPI0034651EF1